MFLGTLVHELLQACLRTKAESAAAVRACFAEIVARKAILQDLLTLGMSVRDVTNEVEPFLPHILFFTEK